MKKYFSFPTISEDEQEDQVDSAEVERVFNSEEYWIGDSDAMVCYGCSQYFSLVKRRHHCRLCGRIFCSNCSSKFQMWDFNIRSCFDCYSVFKRGNLNFKEAKNLQNLSGLDSGPTFLEQHTHFSQAVIWYGGTPKSVHKNVFDITNPVLGLSHYHDRITQIRALTHGSRLLGMFHPEMSVVSSSSVNTMMNAWLTSLRSSRKVFVEAAIERIYSFFTLLFTSHGLDIKCRKLAQSLHSFVESYMSLSFREKQTFRDPAYIMPTLRTESACEQSAASFTFHDGLCFKHFPLYIHQAKRVAQRCLLYVGSLGCVINRKTMLSTANIFDASQHLLSCAVSVAKRIADHEVDIVLLSGRISTEVANFFSDNNIIVIPMIPLRIIRIISILSGQRAVFNVCELNNELDFVPLDFETNSDTFTRIQHSSWSARTLELSCFGQLHSIADEAVHLALREFHSALSINELSVALGFSISPMNFLAFPMIFAKESVSSSGSLSRFFPSAQMNNLPDAPKLSSDSVSHSFPQSTYYTLHRKSTLDTFFMPSNSILLSTADVISVKRHKKPDFKRLFKQSLSMAHASLSSVSFLFSMKCTSPLGHCTQPQYRVIHFDAESDCLLGEYVFETYLAVKEGKKCQAHEFAGKSLDQQLQEIVFDTQSLRESPYLQPCSGADITHHTSVFYCNDVVVECQVFHHTARLVSSGCLYAWIADHSGSMTSPPMRISSTLSFGRFLCMLFTQPTGQLLDIFNMKDAGRSLMGCNIYVGFEDIAICFSVDKCIIYELSYNKHITDVSAVHTSQRLAKELETMSALGNAIYEAFINSFRTLLDEDVFIEESVEHTQLRDDIKQLQKEHKRFGHNLNDIAQRRSILAFNNVRANLLNVVRNWQAKCIKYVSIGNQSDLVNITTRKSAPYVNVNFVSPSLSPVQSPVEEVPLDDMFKSDSPSELEGVDVSPIHRPTPFTLGRARRTPSPFAGIRSLDIRSQPFERTVTPPAPRITDPGEELMTDSDSGFEIDISTLTNKSTDVQIVVEVNDVGVSTFFPPSLHLTIPDAITPMRFVPIREDEPSSIISCVISSTLYEETLASLSSSCGLADHLYNRGGSLDAKEKCKLQMLYHNSDMVSAQIVLESKKLTRFTCIVYFPLQFEALRKVYMGENSDYIESLSRCNSLQAIGGKSGAEFFRTQDGRFILKSIKGIELDLFLTLGPAYFEYMVSVLFGDVPSVLVKILGLYTITYKTFDGQNVRLNLLVMENFWYRRSVDVVYDLKGSLRNRYARNKIVDDRGEIKSVFLDENLVENNFHNQLFTSARSKRIFNFAIHNDSQFLMDNNVVDYSLLIGINEDKQEIAVGIIDYVRSYTWDKRVESILKSSGIFGESGKRPTVVPPEIYQKRFKDALWRYFIALPKSTFPLPPSQNFLNPDSEEIDREVLSMK
ncbi:hypothetical protein PCE1_001642 [Barthelona sp. PCE]